VGGWQRLPGSGAPCGTPPSPIPPSCCGSSRDLPRGLHWGTQIWSFPLPAREAVLCSPGLRHKSLLRGGWCQPSLAAELLFNQRLENLILSYSHPEDATTS